ncbi:MAG TPA: hypothetical protein VFF91_11880 [Pseudoxanthomonas sp.]|nr:hypothetical protein [Pseudoxanthomonas sp.]
MKTRNEIDAELARLEKHLPGLVQQYVPEQALDTFAREARTLTADPPPEHEAYIHRRINCMLASAGLTAGEAEGEPCPRGD